MLSALKDVNVVHQRATEGTLRQHALDGVAQHLVDAVWTCAQVGRRIETLTAWITSIACVNLVSLFLARELNLGCVDDDHVVTAVYVRCEAGLVFAAEQLCDL